MYLMFYEMPKEYNSIFSLLPYKCLIAYGQVFFGVYPTPVITTQHLLCTSSVVTL